jgi:hypothetical protein
MFMLRWASREVEWLFSTLKYFKAILGIMIHWTNIMVSTCFKWSFFSYLGWSNAALQFFPAIDWFILMTIFTSFKTPAYLLESVEPHEIHGPSSFQAICQATNQSIRSIDLSTNQAEKNTHNHVYICIYE